MNNLCKKYKITKDVDGKEVTFYSIPFGTFKRLKHVAKKSAPFIASMMVDTSKDAGTESVATPSGATDGNGDAYFNTQNSVKEISPQMAALRLRQKTEAIEAIVDTLLSNEAEELLEEILIKSVPDEFSDSDRGQIADNMPPAMVYQYLLGVYEASKEGLGQLGKSLFPSRIKDQAAEVVKAVKDLTGV